MSDEMKISFGITKDTKTTNNTPILVATKVEGNSKFPNGWKFPIANLVNIIANPEFKLKDETTTSVLQFVFTDKDKRQFIHTEWKLDTTDEHFQTKLEGMQVRIAHIYSAIFGSVPASGIGSGATNFDDFFAKVKQAFEAQKITKDDAEVMAYTRVPMYIKVVYYKKNITFPLSPNFVERVVKDRPCTTLNINTGYDKLEPPKSGGGGIPGVGGSAPSTDDLPSFDEDFG